MYLQNKSVTLTKSRKCRRDADNKVVLLDADARASGRLLAASVNIARSSERTRPLQASLRRCLFVLASHRASVRLADLRVSCQEGARTLAKQGHLYDFSGMRGM